METDFVRRISKVLCRAQVPFEIEDGAYPLIRLVDASEAETRYVVRILERARYVVIVQEKDTLQSTKERP